MNIALLMPGLSEHLFARLLKAVARYDAAQTNSPAKQLCSLPRRGCSLLAGWDLCSPLLTSCHAYFITAAYVIAGFFKITFCWGFLCFQSSTQQMSSGKTFCGLLLWPVVVSTKGVLYLTLLLERNIQRTEVNLAGKFKGVYMGRREGEAINMQSMLA